VNKCLIVIVYQSDCSVDVLLEVFWGKALGFGVDPSLILRMQVEL